MSTPTDRARGALYGLAIGDALGMPTQSMSRRGRGLLRRPDGFREAPETIPIAAGLPAGSITDDTEQALLLADALLVGGGHLETEDLARRLVVWAERARERGSLDLLGPSSSAAVAAAAVGAPLDETRFGATNGAAMRITPVGVMMSTDDLDALVDLVVEASRVTHHTVSRSLGRRRLQPLSVVASAERRSLRLRRSASEPPSWVSGGANGLPGRLSPAASRGRSGWSTLMIMTAPSGTSLS